MKIARVTGTVVSTIHHPIVDGRRLLVCDFLDERGEPSGGYTLAFDTVDAGVGDLVLILDEGNSARQILAGHGLDARDAPVRALVVGVVDTVDLLRDVE